MHEQLQEAHVSCAVAVVRRGQSSKGCAWKIAIMLKQDRCNRTGETVRSYLPGLKLLAGLSKAGHGDKDVACSQHIIVLEMAVHGHS